MERVCIERVCLEPLCLQIARRRIGALCVVPIRDLLEASNPDAVKRTPQIGPVSQGELIRSTEPLKCIDPTIGRSTGTLAEQRQ